MIFLDGICPKCGSQTHGYSLDDPMQCSKCSWESDVEPEDVRAVRGIIQKKRRAETAEKNRAAGIDVARLRQARLGSKISSIDMAGICHVRPSEYAFWEQGDRPMPLAAWKLCRDYLDF